jgi:hypothetical protein
MKRARCCGHRVIHLPELWRDDAPGERRAARIEDGKIVDGKNNPKFIEFQTEFNALLQEEKELEYKPVSLSELENIESDGNYPTFFKLVVADEQA